MKSLIEKGVVGEVDLVLAVKGSGLLRGWLLEEPKGGGVLRYLGVHLIDQVLWMVGSKPEKVFAEVKLHPTFGVDESSSFTIRFGNGVLASLSLTMRASKSIDLVEIIGSEGHMKSEWRENYLFVHSLKTPEYANPTTIRFMEDPTYPMFERELREFIASAKEGRTPSITVLDGLRVLEVVDAVLESAKLKRVVAI
jgi:predicted dehydrogenase